MVTKKRLLVLISGGGSNLQALIDACLAHEIHAEIVSVISNRSQVYGLERARQAGIPTQIIDHTQYADRTAFDQQLMQAIDAQQPDLVVLAGFMRILTTALVEHYQGKMINIHPSLLPAYKGTHTHQRVLENGEAHHGATVHFVTPELDGGPLIIQARVPILADDTADRLAQRVLKQEHQIYPKAAAWYCEERLQLRDGLVYLDGKILSEPVMH